jgi:Kef-type K+ transport system membrane component KefB
VDHHSFTLLNDIALSIIFAAAAGQLAKLARQPTILGYVLGGVALGAPLGLGLVSNPESIELISEMGLIFLLFIIGLEIQLPELARLGKSTFAVGLVQFGGCVGLGMLLFRPLGVEGGRFTLLYLAICAALSSTLIVVKLLHDKAEIHTTSGRLTIGVLVLQDIFAIVFMAIQPSLLEPQLGTLARSLGYAVALVALSFAVSRYVLGPVFRWAAKVPELVLLTSIGWCFGVAGLAQMAGLSREMGALFAGMSIAAFPYGADVSAKLAGIRDFFVTLFFVSLGLKLPVPTLGTLELSLAAAGIVLVTRLVTIVPTAWLLHLGLRTGTVTALNLAQISEFSLVILGLGVTYGHVTPALQSTVLAAMLLASVLSTYVITFNDRIARLLVAGARLLGSRERAPERTAPHAHGEARDIVLLGCFREGLALLDRIEAELPSLKPRILVIDFNLALRARLESAGFAWAYGDLAHPETLAHLGLERARVVVSTIPDTFLKGTTNRKLLLHAQQIAPAAHFVVTGEDARAQEDLHTLGAQDVVIPSELTADRLLALLRPHGERPKRPTLPPVEPG